MEFAINEANQRVDATPSSRASCPICKTSVIAKCGEIKVWHWAHLVRDCDKWTESESPWHRFWKAVMPSECTEVVIGPHRADIRTKDNTVIELQHSSISSEEIREREHFYTKHGKMIWLFDATEWGNNFSIRLREGDSSNYVSFRWKYPHRSHEFSMQPRFYDLGGNRILEVKKTHWDGQCVGGWGYITTRSAFASKNMSGILTKNGKIASRVPLSEWLSIKCGMGEHIGEFGEVVGEDFGRPPANWVQYCQYRVCTNCGETERKIVPYHARTTTPVATRAQMSLNFK